MLLVVLQQHRLTKQITERNSERPRHIREHIQPTDLPLATLDLAQPILSPTHQVSEHNLRQPAATPVEGDTLADAELITCTTHVPTLSTALPVLAIAVHRYGDHPLDRHNVGRPRSGRQSVRGRVRPEMKPVGPPPTRGARRDRRGQGHGGDIAGYTSALLPQRCRLAG